MLFYSNQIRHRSQKENGHKYDPNGQERHQIDGILRQKCRAKQFVSKHQANLIRRQLQKQIEKGEKVIMKTNSFVRSNALNHENTKIETGEKVVKETNSPIRDNCLNYKIIDNEEEKIESDGEEECKFQNQKQKEAEEDESEGDGNKYKQKQCDRRENAPSSWQKKFKTSPSFTVRQFRTKSQSRETALYKSVV